MYDIDTEKGTVRYRATASDHTVELPLDPMHGTVGVAPGGFEARSSITCDAHGGNIAVGDGPTGGARVAFTIPVAT